MGEYLLSRRQVNGELVQYWYISFGIYWYRFGISLLGDIRGLVRSVAWNADNGGHAFKAYVYSVYTVHTYRSEHMKHLMNTYLRATYTRATWLRRVSDH